MSAVADRWVQPRSRSPMRLSLTWWSAGALGGAAGGLVPDPLLGAAVSGVLIGLLQALAFRPDLRYGTAWFGATALGGTIGFGAMLVGAIAFSEVAGGTQAQLEEGLLAWIALGALGGLLFAAAQAPLTGRAGLALTWCVLGLIGGGVLWPSGYAMGRRFGPDLASSMAELAPQLPWPASGEIEQAGAFALAWLLHALPFGLLVASRSGGER